MANRWRINGTSNWDASTTTNWSATDGGGGGASVPTTADPVFFKNATGTHTLTAAGNCNGIDFTGFSTSPVFAFGTQRLDCRASFTAISGQSITFTAANATLRLWAASGSVTITTAGKTLPYISFFGANGTATYTLQDDLISSDNASDGVNFLGTGTFDANGHGMKAAGFYNNGAVLNMGSGTWEATKTNQFSAGGAWVYASGTINAQTSTIKFTDTTNTAITFAGGGKTYYNLWFARGISTAVITITGANTFRQLKDTGTGTHTITFPNSTTHVTDWQISGTVGHLITLQRTGGSGTWTLALDAGNVSCDYISISNCTVSGGTLYAGTHSTDGGGNTNVVFTDPPPLHSRTLLGIGT